MQASVNDASMWPPSEKRKLDVFKRAANKATDDRAIARVMHILMRCVLSQRKVSTPMWSAMHARYPLRVCHSDMRG